MRGLAIAEVLFKSFVPASQSGWSQQILRQMPDSQYCSISYCLKIQNVVDAEIKTEKAKLESNWKTFFEP